MFGFIGSHSLPSSPSSLQIPTFRSLVIFLLKDDFSLIFQNYIIFNIRLNHVFVFDPVVFLSVSSSLESCLVCPTFLVTLCS